MACGAMPCVASTHASSHSCASVWTSLVALLPAFAAIFRKSDSEETRDAVITVGIASQELTFRDAMASEEEPVGVGAAFLVDAFVYALVALVAAVQLARNCCRYRPWTAQKMIHLLLFLATLRAFERLICCFHLEFVCSQLPARSDAVRAVFLVLVGFDWCDALTGEVNASACDTAERDLFYVLDQLPVLALFATYALLMQFWAEVYYNAVDQLAVLASFVKPMVKALIAVRGLRALVYKSDSKGAYSVRTYTSTGQIVVVCQLLFWVFYASVWRTERTCARFRLAIV